MWGLTVIVSSAQSIAIDDENSAQHRFVISPRLVVQLRANKGGLGYLLVGQSAKVTKVTAPFLMP
ncbi:hypothetical protein [uncultured Ruegeria sp.]|nr:hypothetical protein [uncultured Ruegeria sp.]